MTTVFVYGTLKRGFSNWRALLAERSTFLGEAVSVAADFAMLDGSFPRLLRRPHGHPVFGELFEVDRKTLQRLDRLENHPMWYQRQRRRFRKADGATVQAWVYIMRLEWRPIDLPEMMPERGTLTWHYKGEMEGDHEK
jgi:gamma-glutamylcyclotransferase (GGCT)/AIG2-like uncharacterized protein YtfP